MCKYNAKVMLIVKVKGYDYKIRKVFIYNIFTELCELKGEACRRYIFHVLFQIHYQTVSFQAIYCTSFICNISYTN